MILRPHKILEPRLLRLLLQLRQPLMIIILRPMMIIMPMPMLIVRWPYILHLIYTATNRTALHRALAVHAQPEGEVGVYWVAGAAGELLEAEGVYWDGVVECAFSAGIEGAHVEDVDALHFAEDFEPFEAGGLIFVCGHCAGFGAGGKEIFFGFDFCWGWERSQSYSLRS